MATLNRDIQALNMSSNELTHLSSHEFAQKKFRNLQKLQLDHNKLVSIEPGAFFKLTGLIELDLSDNLLERLEASKAETTTATVPENDEERAKHSEISKTSSSKTNQTRVNALATGSFLQDLAQLRQLNLNSNKLRRLAGFAFSLVAQLRQLYLSR